MIQTATVIHRPMYSEFGLVYKVYIFLSLQTEFCSNLCSLKVHCVCVLGMVCIIACRKYCTVLCMCVCVCVRDKEGPCLCV